MSGMRNPMLYQYVNHEMLCALTYFMRNPKNWTLEENTPPGVLNDGSTELEKIFVFELELSLSTR
eukprot:4449412-Amphidinium_carterae.1